MHKSNAKLISPEFLGELEAERLYSDNLYTRTRRVKLEKGESCLIRVLPIAMGKSGSYTARIAQHWLNKKSVVCPRYTHPDFGGDPKAHCEACEVTDEAYHQCVTDEDRQFAKDASYKVKWQAWCLVFERDNGRKVEVAQPPEVWLPYELSMSKTTFDELSALVQRSARTKGNPRGILDLKQGCDLWLTRSANNYRLDKSDSGPTPIADVDDKFDALVDKILDECHIPSVRVATSEVLENFALKFSEALAAVASRSRRSGGAGTAGRASRSEDEGGPRSRRDEGGDGGDAPRHSLRPSAGEDLETPARSVRRQVDEEQPVSEPVRRRPVAEAQPSAPRTSRRSEEPPMDDSNPELAPVPRRSQPEPEAQSEAAPAQRLSRLSRLPGEDAAPPSRAQSSPPRRVAEAPEDADDSAPEEARDPVPAASADPADGGDDAAPRSAPTALSSALRRNIGALNRKSGA